MIIIKSFLRRKTTKVYICIISILLIIVMLLLTFTNYVKYLENELFFKYTDLIVISDTNIINELNDIEYIDNIENILVLSENHDYEVFVDSSYSIYDSNGNLIDYYENNSDKPTWDVLEIDLGDYLLVEKASDYGLTLSNDEVVIGLDETIYEIYKDTYYEYFIGKSIGFIYNEDNIEFNIVDLVVGNSSLIISDGLYDELLNNSSTYAYKANATIFRKQTELKDKLSNITDSENYYYSIVSYYPSEYSNTQSNLYDLFDLLNILSYIAVLIFIIVLVIITKNMIKDYAKDLVIYRKIGYRKMRLKLQTIKNILLVYIIVNIISIIIYLLLLLILNHIFEINLIYVGLIKLLEIFILESITTFIITLLFLRVDKIT